MPGVWKYTSFDGSAAMIDGGLSTMRLAMTAARQPRRRITNESERRVVMTTLSGCSSRRQPQIHSRLIPQWLRETCPECHHERATQQGARHATGADDFHFSPISQSGSKYNGMTPPTRRPRRQTILWSSSAASGRRGSPDQHQIIGRSKGQSWPPPEFHQFTPARGSQPGGEGDLIS